MNSFQLKVLACLFMLVDHLGVFMFPQWLVFRLIGRLAFPLFAWMIAIGYLHTSSILKYLERLIVFAVVLQIPYTGYFKSLGLNIFFTLFFGLLSIYIFDQNKNKFTGIVSVIIISILSQVINVDYGAYGVLTIFSFYFFRHHPKQVFFAQAIINILYVTGNSLFSSLTGTELSSIVLIQPVSLAALFLISLYNGERGRKMKYTFYAFYPAHLVTIYTMKLLLDSLPK